MSDGNDKIELLVRAWEKTVDVQQHFNDLCLRVRNFAITVLTAVLGGAALAFKDMPHLAPWILAAGVIAWLGFFIMDAFWYHRLLLGSVANGEDIENTLEQMGVKGYGLTKKIREMSAVKIGGMEFRSLRRLNTFYVGGLVLFVMLGVAAWLTGEPEKKSTAAVSLEATALNAEPALLFPTNGSVLHSGAVAFGWKLVKGAEQYSLEVETQKGEKALAVVLPQNQGSFVCGVEFLGKTGKMRWRSVPLDRLGQPQYRVTWQDFEVTP